MGMPGCIDRGALLQRAFDGASIGLAVVDSEGRCVEVNEALCRIVDRDRAVVLGRPLAELLQGDDRQPDGAPVEQRFIGSDGSTTWALVLRTALPERGSLVQVIDISGQKQADVDREAALVHRDRLLAGLSHEIRSPLTSVCGIAEELFAGWETFPNAERHELLKMLVEGGRRTALTVDNFVIAARDAAGTVRVDWGSVDLEHEVRTVAAGLAADARVDIATLPIRVVGDPLRVRQILHNVMALALSPDGAQAQIVVAHVAPRGIVRVTSLFAAPAGASPPRDDWRGEMGWFVARRIAELMGGTLSAVERPASIVFELALPTEHHG
jgi:PAS domain S-box-containing protein